jgi:hypothetical protein
MKGCAVWLFVEDRVCSRKATKKVVFKKRTEVKGLAVGGTYEKGTWDVCAQHANLIEKGRQGA